MAQNNNQNNDFQTVTYKKGKVAPVDFKNPLSTTNPLSTISTTNPLSTTSKHKACRNSQLKNGNVFYSCTHESCPYAHSIEELEIAKCRYPICKKDECMFLHGTKLEHCIKHQMLLPETPAAENGKINVSENYCNLFRIPVPKPYIPKSQREKQFERVEKPNFHINNFPALPVSKSVKQQTPQQPVKQSLPPQPVKQSLPPQQPQLVKPLRPQQPQPVKPLRPQQPVKQSQPLSPPQQSQPLSPPQPVKKIKLPIKIVCSQQDKQKKMGEILEISKEFPDIDFNVVFDIC